MSFPFPQKLSCDIICSSIRLKKWDTSIAPRHVWSIMANEKFLLCWCSIPVFFLCSVEQLIETISTHLQFYMNALCNKLHFRLPIVQVEHYDKWEIWFSCCSISLFFLLSNNTNGWIDINTITHLQVYMNGHCIKLHYCLPMTRCEHYRKWKSPCSMCTKDYPLLNNLYLHFLQLSATCNCNVWNTMSLSITTNCPFGQLRILYFI